MFVFHTAVCATCDKIFHAWLRRFARHFDAWFYLLYLHPIFTIEEFLDEKLIYGYSVCQSCPLIIILIITIVCCVYAYFIYHFVFVSTFCFQILTLTLLRFHIWVILLQDIGANERELYQHVEFWGKGEKKKEEEIDLNVWRASAGKGFITVVVKGVNVCPTSHLPCVTRYCGVAAHVESPCVEVGMFWEPGILSQKIARYMYSP